MVSRTEHWEALDDYEQQIVSLYHRPAGQCIRERIANLDLAGKAAADIGCGPGYFLEALASANTLYAVDFAANMLAQARTRGPAQTTYIQSHLIDFQPDEPLDCVLCLNALMPENHTQALAMLEKLFSLLNPGGILFLVVPSMESFLYRTNMEHFMAAREGKEEDSLVQRMTDFVNNFNNPLGYVKDANAGQVVKYWLKDELVNLLTLYPTITIQEIFKAPVFWQDYTTPAEWQAQFEAPWCWGLLLSINNH